MHKKVVSVRLCQDYAVECLAREREKVLEALDVSGVSDRHLAATRELLENPAVFLHKWIGEGLVGVLDLPAVLLAWDQLFMRDWSRRVMEDFCLALLLLLREALLAARDYPALREVMLVHPSHLFTADIRRAWVHLQQGGLADDIPGLNRLDTRFLYGPSPQEAAPHEYLGQILPIGLKDINLLLILDLPEKAQFPQASPAGFDPHAVNVTATVVHGDVNLHSKPTLLKPSVEVKSPRRHSAPPEYRLRYSDVLCFDSLDLSDFRGKLSKKDRPAVVFEVAYTQQENTGFAPMMLGWAKGEAQGSPWNHTLSQGPTGLLQTGSELQMTTFDPSRETQRLLKTMSDPSSEESPFQYPPWIPHNPSLSIPRKSSTQQPFDLYIDSVHYIPDNASIIKVTGALLHSGLEDVPEIQALPDLSSSARSPEFSFRLTADPGGQTTFDPGTLLLLRAHTLCADTGALRAIGGCVLRVFDGEARLNAGGHQCRLRRGPTQSEETPPTEALQHQLAVPCTTVLLRLLPHTPDALPAPHYLSGFYFSDDAKPNRSELEIISTFQRDRGFPETVRNMVEHLAEKEKAQVLPEQAPGWLEDRLDVRKGNLSHQPPALLPVLRMVRYRQEAGVRVRVTQAFGLPDGLYVNAFTRVLKGSDTLRVPELPQGWGGDEKFLTCRHDYSSLQRAPRWTDQSSVLHPCPDPHTVLLVQLFGLDAVYRPDPSGQGCGTVSAPARGRLGLDYKSQLAWALVPLFDGACVRSGVHYAPLFQGSPDRGFLGYVVSCPVKEATAGHLKSRTLKLWRGSASLAVQVWDGHFLDDERPDLPVLDGLLPADRKKKFLKTQCSRSGKELSQLVLQTLGRRARRKGRGSVEYQREEAFYEQAMGSTFCTLMETSLMNAGYGPL
ncbi:hypothetical protein COCON_G00191910 [Conger conger]|uniref:Uncharacterized protein n=1 Tax=Conger conger TaxID=82655 RepID=A0A9Q1D4C1_CONCO|nr:hypothetical protein COCON_G00191910 [Conger conger]